MERADILELMTRLKLYGMRAAYDEVMTTGIKRRHEPARIVGELLSAEVAEKQGARARERVLYPHDVVSVSGHLGSIRRVGLQNK